MRNKHIYKGAWMGCYTTFLVDQVQMWFVALFQKCGIKLKNILNTKCLIYKNDDGLLKPCFDPHPTMEYLSQEQYYFTIEECMTSSL